MESATFVAAHALTPDPSNITCKVLVPSFDFNGETVFSARLSSGIAANPYLRFFVTARESGPITIEWLDDGGVRGSERAAVTVA